MYVLPPFDDHFDPWKHNKFLAKKKKTGTLELQRGERMKLKCSETENNLE